MYICKKHNKVVDIEKDDCTNCMKKGKSGLADKVMCQQFNLDIKEGYNNVIPKLRL